ncbi:MAG TPA: hypothetical protein VK013_02955 [Myxococcaceae bacterium]|nr:hypothetical protein [Myxococcaceae bacterium]
MSRSRVTATLMVSSAVFLLLCGAGATFLPAELLQALGTPATAGAVVLVQIGGAAVLGFAMLNWMSRGSVLGGIYGRPLIVGNLLHFGAGGIGAVKLLRVHDGLAPLWPVGIGYAIFGVAFAALMLWRPGAAKAG